MKRRSWIFLFLLLSIAGSFLVYPIDARESISAEPAKLTIEMGDKYPEETVNYNIRVTNTYSYDVEVLAKVINPLGLTKNYIKIPDLSWIDVNPKIINVPAYSSAEFEIIIKVPDEEKPFHYNESWEVWVLVTPHVPSEVDDESSVGTTFRIKYAIKVLISTPNGEKKLQSPQNLYIFLAGLIGFIVLAAIYFYVKGKRKIESNRAAIFYVKKKENGIHKNKKFE